MYVNGANHGNCNGSATSNGVNNFTIWSKEVNLSEIIVFDHVLKNEERQLVEDYLAKKYGIKVAKNTSDDAPQT